jgi:DUF4097 and DUF4098 domain-containing protein YvlB
MNLIKTSMLTMGLLTAQYGLAQDDTFKLDKSYEIEPKGTIHLNTDDANIRIIGSDRKDVHVEIFRKITRKGMVFGNETFEVQITPRNGNLYIKDEQLQVHVGVVGYVREEYEITIEAPNGVSLDIDGDDDDYNIRNIHGSIAMDVDDGDAQLTNCQGDSFEFNFDDGDLTMDRASGSLKLSLDDGDAEIQNASFDHIDARADDGDIELATSLSDHGNYSFRVDDGNIDLTVLKGGGTFHIYHDDGHVSASQDFQIKVKEEDETKLELNTGTAQVKIRSDDASVRLKSF